MSFPRQPQPVTAAPQGDLAAAIAAFLGSRGVPPTQTWLQSFLPSIRASTPIQALQKTALFRLLTTDITSTIIAKPASSLPAGVAEPSVKEIRLPGPIPLQILDIEDVGHSRWSQVETIEAQERGEFTKGREVIRVLPDEENPGSTSTTQAPTGESKSTGPHKLLLQDAKGTKVYGFEMRDVQGINVSIGIGAKLVVRNVLVARGVVMLEPSNVEVLGGRVGAWDEEWRKQRKATLKGKAGIIESG